MCREPHRHTGCDSCGTVGHNESIFWSNKKKPKNTENTGSVSAVIEGNEVDIDDIYLNGNSDTDYDDTGEVERFRFVIEDEEEAE